MPQSPSLTLPKVEPKRVLNDTLLSRSELVVGYLQNLALPSLGNRQLSEKDYEAWDKLLEPYSKGAIAYAFENWVRNGRGFPQVAVIIALAKTHAVCEEKEFHGCGKCFDGWLYSRDDPGRYRLGVKRCSCFAAWAERKKAV